MSAKAKHVVPLTRDTDTDDLYMRVEDTGIHAIGELPVMPSRARGPVMVKVADVATWYEREAKHEKPQRAAECRTIVENLRRMIAANTAGAP